MKRFWFKLILWTFIPFLAVGLALCSSARTVVLAQEPTAVQNDVFVTVTNAEQINVRIGPDTQLYDIIGHMQPGEQAVALGISPGRDWIQIAFPSAPGGVAWVYASLVSISSGNLRIVEPPPTTPTVTITIDPTLAAAYVFEPTATRLPTFTSAPPLTVPHYTEAPPTASRSQFPIGALLLGLGIPGIVGFLFLSLRRRHW